MATVMYQFQKSFQSVTLSSLPEAFLLIYFPTPKYDVIWLCWQTGLLRFLSWHQKPDDYKIEAQSNKYSTLMTSGTSKRKKTNHDIPFNHTCFYCSPLLLGNLLSWTTDQNQGIVLHYRRNSSRNGEYCHTWFPFEIRVHGGPMVRGFSVNF